MNILDFFGTKPEKLNFQPGSYEAQVSDVRLQKVAEGVNDLYRALQDMGAEDYAKTAQNQQAAEMFQAAVQVTRNDERTANVAKAITHTEVTAVPAEANIPQNNLPQRIVAENNTQPTVVSASSTKEARVTDAQANVAAALQNAGDK